MRNGPAASSDAGGFRAILIATAAAGAAGYLIQAVAAAGLSPAGYARFGVFWATLYLLVGAVGGIQQEISRASRPAELTSDAGGPRRLLGFGIASAAVAASLVLASAPLWGPASLGSDWVTAIAPLVIGTMAYVAFATVMGAYYGVSAWALVALLIVIEPALRVVTVGFSVAAQPAWLYWAIVVPMPIAFTVAILVGRRRLQTVGIVEPIGVLLANAARTVVGSAATAVLISAFPLFLAASAPHEDRAGVGALIFNLTITRAPLVIPVLALQAWLVVFFRDRRDRLARSLWRTLGIFAGVSAILAAIAWLIVPTIVGWLFGRGYVLDRWATAGIVLTAGLTAALCVSGAITVSQSGHTAYLAGWVAAAAVSVAALVLPIDLTARTVVALALGPVIGLCVHLAYLAATLGRQRPRT